MDVTQVQLNGEAIRQELVKQYNRATTTSTDDVDLLAIDLFATMVQQYEFITVDATKIIAEKFKSTNANEVLLALNVLEECMCKCGPKFHSEIGKFRFLNELIRLVSPQHDGDKTPKEIRNKILDLMLLWTVTFPNEKKIKEAYDMLLKRGVKHETAKPVVVQNNNKYEQRDTGEPDLAAKLQRLLRSSNPGDYKAANLLIQNMVKEKERRHEVKVRRKLELQEITDNATLLKEMLEQLEADQKQGLTEDVTEDTLATLKFLYDSCQKLQPTILILIGDTDDHESLEDALETNDLVKEVFAKYHHIIIKNRSKFATSCLIGTPALTSGQNGANRNAMDELHEIFASSSSNNASTAANQSASQTMTLMPLEPTPVAAVSNVNGSPERTRQAILDLSDATSSLDPLAASPPQPNPVDAFDILSNGSCSAATIPLSNSPSIPTISAAPVAQAKPSAQTKFQNFDSQLTELISGLKSDLKKDTDDLLSADDEQLILEEPAETAQNQTEQLLVDEIPTVPIEERASPANLNKALADIIVNLNDIRPHDEHTPRCILDDKSALKIMLNFAKDKPRSDVAVLVITTTNQNQLPIKHFQFEASVPKPCKLHLQKPSGNELAGTKPFRPPTDDITQILLISNPEKKPLKLVCIISYMLGDDPDMVKEFLEINDLPDL